VVLLQRGANTKPADDARGFIPLHWAVANNDPGMVRILLDRGADAQATDKQGNVPCQEGLNRGYSRNTRFMERLCLGYTPPPPIEGLQWFTETPLHRAAYEGSRSDVEALLNQGADIHATANIAVDGHRWEGITPLHVATLNPDMAVAELLLDRGADIHAVAMANGAWTMVHFALQSQRSDELQAMINFLISRGAQI
jgi:ankyrin repeat protein